MDSIMEVVNLHKQFEIKTGLLTKAKINAVDGVSFNLVAGETLGVVGESGSGKSTLGRTILKLTNADSGKVIYKGEDLVPLTSKQMKRHRSQLQMIFQDPYASLNPRLKVGTSISEPMLANNPSLGRDEAKRSAIELLELVGLSPQMYNLYPHEFSGGQRQRISIARAIAPKPSIIVCDEAVSALDVSVQAQMLNLFNELKEKLSLTYIFIGHDLSVIKYISDRILVMYLGQVVELAPTDAIFGSKMHPYTQALVSAVPEPNATKRQSKRIILEGDIPSPGSVPKGCQFASRCFMKMKMCMEAAPNLTEVEEGHLVRCHHHARLKKAAQDVPNG
ncbi:MAG: ATP-binding cassette domain-containing protein [Eubacteriaceae bacterium]|nr:ATP-binding cassette domain-containing protein [Eubacteriaceae bacterium]